MYNLKVKLVLPSANVINSPCFSLKKLSPLRLKTSFSLSLYGSQNSTTFTDTLYGLFVGSNNRSWYFAVPGSLTFPKNWYDRLPNIALLAFSRAEYMVLGLSRTTQIMVRQCIEEWYKKVWVAHTFFMGSPYQNI